MGLIVVLIAIQFIRPSKTNPKIDSKIALEPPSKVLKVLKKSCYDCHSFETKWSIYSEIAPLSWVIVSHVEDGRKALNFSKFKEIDKEIKKARLKRLVKIVDNGMMPLSSYLSLHSEAKLSKKDKIFLKEWANTTLEDLK